MQTFKVGKNTGTKAARRTTWFGMVGFELKDYTDSKEVDGDFAMMIDQLVEKHGTTAAQEIAAMNRGRSYFLQRFVGSKELVASKTERRKAVQAEFNKASEKVASGDMTAIPDIQRLLPIVNGSDEETLKWWQANPEKVEGFLASRSTEGQPRPVKLEGGEVEFGPAMRLLAKDDGDESELE